MIIFIDLINNQAIQNVQLDHCHRDAHNNLLTHPPTNIIFTIQPATTTQAQVSTVEPLRPTHKYYQMLHTSWLRYGITGLYMGT